MRSRPNRDLHAIRREIQAARSQPFTVPTGHVAAMAAARVFGPHDATTPEGHPILIFSGVFDSTVETPQDAIARAAQRWHGIVPHPAHWVVEMHESVSIPAQHPMHGRVPWSDFFHLAYIPERWKWQRRGLHNGNVPNPFKESWYLARNWQQAGNPAKSI